MTCRCCFVDAQVQTATVNGQWWSNYRIKKGKSCFYLSWGPAKIWLVSHAWVGMAYFSLYYGADNTQIILFFKLYFIGCAITGVLNFFPLPLPPSTPHSLRQPPPTIVHVHGSCISYLATPFPILQFTSPWLFCQYLFVLLNPLTSSSIPPYFSPFQQPSKQSPYP